MNPEPGHRNLTEIEIKSLESSGCTCNSWNDVTVKDGFHPGGCRNVHFSGRIKLGVFSEGFTDDSGVMIRSGIMNAHLHNCTVGDDVSVYNVRDYIANYSIGNRVVIRNCGKIHTEELTSFGNGTLVAVLNETGARAVRIWDRLTAHQAYIIALYRHRTKAIDRIEKLISEYAGSVSSDTGVIGEKARILNCQHIRNVVVGPSAVVDGALRLNDGSLNSSPDDPVFIGPGVIMDHFIVCSGSTVTDSAIIDKCFIGQGCVLGKQYSAENSLFFANCGGFHGEACSIFAGPYTVTHHKSTLLIAGIFSFMNAGSGSNQSNHMYKLGPIHQGIVERGSKTTSDSYLLWPARIGPFTLVMGRHYKNLDTTSLPFSYLIESNDESVLVPAVNLRSVGTIRDAQKWPLRDKRRDPVKYDLINFNLLSPFTITKMMAGRDILINLQRNSGQGSDYYYYHSMKISRHSLERGIELYQKGIDKFLGNSIIKRLEGITFSNNEEIRTRLRPDPAHGTGEWIDLAGLIAPKDEVDEMLERLESGLLSSLGEMSLHLSSMHANYYEWEWTWAAGRIEEETGKPLDDFTSTDVIAVVEKWKKSVVELDNLLYEDARKEFTLSSMTGFGMDWGDSEKIKDFGQVRGDFESNSVVSAIRDHIMIKSELGDELIGRMKNVVKN
ncbi:MAG TPA: DUF4954 family protein [Bacteroidales bacterium]|nr:DUF4954 family protein [Bacteroidales bacterium]